ncbi:MAG TPA: hypothetical protein G4O10_00295 [Dehalococcoidia bacterium]|nr:hypothetical protein [Dehalococcoidia bacterium]
MLIRKKKHNDDVRNAYITGLEQGFELANKLKEIMSQKRKDSVSLPDKDQLKEFSLFLRHLLEIARSKGIDLE